jgi:hypothetical protein
VVEALDHERERDRRRDEDDPEAEHDRVLVRELVPVQREVAADGIAQVRREQEREEHRGEPEHAPDRPLDVPQDEHAEREEQDQQVELVDRAQEAADVHSRSLERTPGPRTGTWAGSG